MTANARFRKSRSGSIGASVRASQPDEQREDQRAAGKRPDDRERAPAVGVAAHDAVDDPEEPCRREHQPDRVEALARAAALHEEQARRRQHEQADRHVEPEDPLPGDAVDDGAADERAERDRETGDARPDAERDPSALGGKGGREQRQAQRQHEGCAGALQRPGGHKLAGALRECRGARGEREERESELEDPAPAEAVAECGSREQQHGERQRVRVHEPAELLDGRTEIGPDARQRGRHDEVVEHDHEQRSTGDRERESRTTARLSWRRAGFAGGGGRHRGILPLEGID